MIDYTVVFTPEAEEQLAELYRYIAVSSSEKAARFMKVCVVFPAEGINAMTFGLDFELQVIAGGL